MDQLVQMQAHIDTLRRQNEELEIMLDEQKTINTALTNRLKGESSFSESMLFKLKKTRLRYRIAVAVLLVFSLWMGITKIQYAVRVDSLEQQVKDLNQSDLQERFDNILDELHTVNSKNQDLQFANEQLINHCRPCDIKKAIKSTRLPALVKKA